jgi:hypothetical protein
LDLWRASCPCGWQTDIMTDLDADSAGLWHWVEAHNGDDARFNPSLTILDALPGITGQVLAARSSR